MKEIIWIFGTSASGKETYIKSFINDARSKTSHITVSEESLTNLGKLDKSREKIIKEVCDLIKTNDYVVIKWQYGDTLLDSPNKILAKLPMFQHKAIVLNVNEKEQIRRLRTKSWWQDTGSEHEFITRELELVDKSIKHLDPSFEVTHITW